VEIGGTGKAEGRWGFWPRGRRSLAGADIGPGIFTGSPSSSTAIPRFEFSPFSAFSLPSNPQCLLRQGIVQRVGEMTTKRKPVNGKTIIEGALE